MKICNKSGIFDFCEFCWHSKPHEEITNENIKLFPKKNKKMGATTVCEDIAFCFGDSRKAIKVSCIEFREIDEKSIKEVMELIECSRFVAIKILDNFHKICEIKGE